MSGRIVIPLIVPDTAIDAEVDLCLVDGAYFLQARLNVSLPGLEREVWRTPRTKPVRSPKPYEATSTS
jgi:hypothetical protein